MHTSLAIDNSDIYYPMKNAASGGGKAQINPNQKCYSSAVYIAQSPSFTEKRSPI
jgi:hypothetical protein